MPRPSDELDCSPLPALDEKFPPPRPAFLHLRPRLRLVPLPHFLSRSPSDLPSPVFYGRQMGFFLPYVTVLGLTVSTWLRRASQNLFHLLQKFNFSPSGSRQAQWSSIRRLLLDREHFPFSATFFQSCSTRVTYNLPLFSREDQYFTIDRGLLYIINRHLFFPSHFPELYDERSPLLLVVPATSR